MIGEKLGPFTIDDKLGAGAMGVVYRATWEPHGQAVAVKVIHQDHATKANATDRFDRESDILKQFRHPNIVRHIGVGYSRARGLRYYAMEYVPGTTLEHVLEERGALPWTEVVTLGLQICEALQYAHERGVVHRDLKPSNLMVTRQGMLKLTDFGIAKDLDRTALTADGRTLGTAAYMAPEQIRGTPEVSHKTDLYALGCLLYQMLTGRTPFDGKSAMVLMHKHLDEPPPRPSAKNPEIPLAMDNLVVQLMAKNCDDRPWDAQAATLVLTELREKLSRSEPVPMVFGPAGSHPTRLGTSGATTARSSAGKSRKGKTAGLRTLNDLPTIRSRLEVLGLVVALVVVASAMAYVLWPPSASYLYGKAKQGMASEARVDWIHARNSMDELDSRFPNHPYKQEVRAWRDRILLGDALRRARILEAPALTALTEPQDVAERLYLDAFKAGSEELDEGRDDEALRRWIAMADYLEKYPEHRSWYLLARKRAEDLRQQMEQRRRIVETEIRRARFAYESGRFDEGIRILNNAIKDYQKYTYLASAIDEARRQRASWTGQAVDAGLPRFPNTPEGAYRTYLFSQATGNLTGLREATAPTTGDEALAGLLDQLQETAPEGLAGFQKLIEEQVPVRQLKVGEEVILPDASTFRVSPEDVGEDRAVVAPESLVGLPLRVRKIDGQWRVDPESVPRIGPDTRTPAPASSDPAAGSVPQPQPATPDASPGAAETAAEPSS